MQLTQVLHYPTLKTILLVEQALKDAKEPVSRYQILKRLNNRVMPQTLNSIIDYLDERGMVFNGKKGVVWVYRPGSEIEKRIREGLEA